MLAVSHLRLHLRPERDLHLPARNKGTTLRGGFGNAFRKLVCVDLRWECAECSLRFTCPYTKIFNPFLPPDAQQFRGNPNIPRPFVFKPPLSDQTTYSPADSLVFDLVVIGSAVDDLPYFIVAFRELGAMGFGLNRAKVRLDRVEAITPSAGRGVRRRLQHGTTRTASRFARHGKRRRNPRAGSHNGRRADADLPDAHNAEGGLRRRSRGGDRAPAGLSPRRQAPARPRERARDFPWVGTSRLVEGHGDREDVMKGKGEPPGEPFDRDDPNEARGVVRVVPASPTCGWPPIVEKPHRSRCPDEEGTE
jgi:hypothetical protein